MSIHTGAMSDPDLDWGIYPSARMQFGSARTASPMHLTDGKDDPYAEYPPPQRRASRCSLCAAVMCAATTFAVSGVTSKSGRSRTM